MPNRSKERRMFIFFPTYQGRWVHALRKEQHKAKNTKPNSCSMKHRKGPKNGWKKKNEDGRKNFPSYPSAHDRSSNWGREKHRKAMSMFYHYELAFPLRISARITSNRKAIGILKFSNICVRLAAFLLKTFADFFPFSICVSSTENEPKKKEKKSGRECHQKAW